jgi:hypothetical protein
VGAEEFIARALRQGSAKPEIEEFLEQFRVSAGVMSRMQKPRALQLDEPIEPLARTPYANGFTTRDRVSL